MSKQDEPTERIQRPRPVGPRKHSQVEAERARAAALLPAPKRHTEDNDATKPSRRPSGGRKSLLGRLSRTVRELLPPRKGQAGRKGREL